MWATTNFVEISGLYFIVHCENILNIPKDLLNTVIKLAEDNNQSC